jgi:hypothetical protein
MSRAVLQEIGPKVRVGGVPWLPPGERKEIGINSLKARILCSRHNNALSPLDAEATRFFATLRTILAEAGRKSLSRKRIPLLFSGEMLELWALKVSYGSFYSGNAAHDRVRLLDNHVLNGKFIHEALRFGIWAHAACGLYFRAPDRHRVSPVDAVEVSPVTSRVSNKVLGVLIGMTGLEFLLIHDPDLFMETDIAADGFKHRPTEFHFRIEKRRYSLILTWPPETQRIMIRLDLSRSPRAKKPRR